MSFMNEKLVKAVIGASLVFAFAMPAVAQELKVGVVSLQAVVERAPQTKALMDTLREEFAPRERAIVAKQKEIEELQTKVQKDLAVMGETERRNAEKNLRDLGREFERMRTEFQEDSNLRQNEEFGVLQRSILKEVQDFAQSEGYDLIVGDGVLYANSTVNITEAVLNFVIANHEATTP
ncbi:MAG: OmpH family outer membrane protein [Gammaproteobacteria bacterium]|jgi:outer membrane protein|nr:OmpH family outer membrane protein [Gammaproteobacteria bacterium]